MSCEKEHISSAGFQRLVQEREDALGEVQTLDAENERLKFALKRIRDCVTSGWGAPESLRKTVTAIIDEVVR